MDIIILFIACLYIFITPYSKVEESFNLQACHDILYHGVNLNEYDHLEYPGVVPRTFIGPLLVSAASSPIVFLIKILDLPKFYSQYVVRLVLAVLSFLAWKHLSKEVGKQFGGSFRIWFLLITASQFHFVYYMSRTLPNTFALIFALLAFSFWLGQHHKQMIWSSAFAGVIFRSELCLFLVPMMLHDLIRKKIRILEFIKLAVPSGVTALFFTVAIDSIFWQRIVWPEGEVLWFNTFLNQSSNWGIYPFLWYWYSAIPRALGLSCVLIPLGMAIDPRIRLSVLPSLMFVLLYSFLPHKELRFILYALPGLNLAATRACQFIWNSRSKYQTNQYLAACCGLHLFLNVAFTSLLLFVSSWNYPGGSSVHLLHQKVNMSDPVHIHIGNLATQTGVSRFSQINSNWSYNKTENLKAGGSTMRSFTHLLVEAKSKYAYTLKHYAATHDILGSVDAFSHLSFNYQSFPPVKFRMKPAIFLLENLIPEDIDWSFVPEDSRSAAIDRLHDKIHLLSGLPLFTEDNLEEENYTPQKNNSSEEKNR